jgi:hypothetical protein
MTSETLNVLDQVARPDLLYNRLAELDAERRVITKLLRVVVDVRDEIDGQHEPKKSA